MTTKAQLERQIAWLTKTMNAQADLIDAVTVRDDWARRFAPLIDTISGRKRSLMLKLYFHGAIEEESCVPAATLAAELKVSTRTIKAWAADLSSLFVVNSRPGAGGGYWLSRLGVAFLAGYFPLGAGPAEESVEVENGEIEKARFARATA